MKNASKLLIMCFCYLLSPNSGLAQIGQEEYDDYGDFSSEPDQLDREVRKVFGRFFQASVGVGTSIFQGGHGEAYAAGFTLNGRFVYYFDKSWAAEIGGHYSTHLGQYNKTTQGQTAQLDLKIKKELIPFIVGLRYGFNHSLLSRGLATLNPYLAINAEVILRRESVSGSTNGALAADQKAKFGDGAIVQEMAYGANIGGGVEFDVYQSIIYLGIDLRYHFVFWPDGNRFFGATERRGNYFTLLAVATYNF